MNVFWFLPLHGDGRYLGTSVGAKAVDYDYLRQIAEYVDQSGYTGVLVPTGKACEDSWVVASALIPVTTRLKFLVAIRPGIMSPTAAARMTATFDRMSAGRLLVNVVTGGDPVELAGDGLFLDHDARYELTDEYLQVWRRLLSGEEVTFAGKHIHTDAASQLFPGLQKPYPPLYFGGSSPAALRIAADHIDYYLTWGEPPGEVAAKVERVRELAALSGRTVRFGIRLHVIVRVTEKEAWQAAEELIRYVDEDTIAAAQQVFERYDSVGQRRMTSLHQGDRTSLEISPNLWAGIGLVRGGAGTALVGDPTTVAERMQEYAALGIETFILSGYPHLEEAQRVAELLFPLLPLRLGSSESLAPEAAIPPVGELVAYNLTPDQLAAKRKGKYSEQT